MVCTPVAPLTSCATLSKTSNLSRLWFSHLENKDNNGIYFKKWLRGLKEKKHVKCLEWDWASGNETVDVGFYC